jgi:hypothetical protein
MGAKNLEQTLKDLGEGLARYHEKNEYEGGFAGEVYEIRVEPDKLCNQTREQVVEKLNDFITHTSLFPYSFLIRDHVKNRDVYRIHMSKPFYPLWELIQLWK